MAQSHERAQLQQKTRGRDEKRSHMAHEKRELHIEARRGRDQKRTWLGKKQKKKRGSGRGRRRKHRVHREGKEEIWRWREPKKRWTPVLPPQSCPLPLHLVVEHILSRLSVRQLCQLRCVCKIWNFVLAARSEFLPDKAKESWFLMRAQNTNKQTGFRTLTAFSSTQGLCSPFRLPLVGVKLSSYLGGSDWAHLGDCLEHPSTHFIASAGGLICTLVQAVHPGTWYDLIVFNCLTGSAKVLPRPPSQGQTLDIEYPYFLLHMAIDNQDPFQYFVMVIENHFKWTAMDVEVPFEVFDSRSGGWKVGSSPTTCKSSTSGLKVVDGDILNSLYHASEGTMDVLAYHAAQDAWSAVQVPLISNDPRHDGFPCPEYWTAPTYLKYEGRLFMGRFLVEDMPIGFEVWELQFSSSGTATLVEVARTPKHLYQPISVSWWTLKAEGFVFYMQLEGLEGKGPPLVYDLAQNSWYVVPSGQAVDCILVHRPRPSMLWYG